MRSHLELEVILCVVVADVFDHLLHAGFLVAGVRDHTVLDVVAEDVTERTTEILMTRVTEERTAVSQHTYHAAQETEVGERHHLLLHTVLLIKEPPTGTELNLTRYTTVLEVTQHGSDYLVGAGVEVIENGLSQMAFRVHLIEEMTHRFGGRELTDGVKTGVCTQLRKHLRVVVTDSTVVVLLGPARSIVHLSLCMQISVLVLTNLVCAEFLACERFLEDGIDLGVGVRLVVELLNTVVTQTATHRLEEVMAFLERIYQIAKLGDCNTANGGEPSRYAFQVAASIFIPASGRQVGSMRTSAVGSSFTILCHSSESAGSSVVQTSSTP